MADSVPLLPIQGFLEIKYGLESPQRTNINARVNALHGCDRILELGVSDPWGFSSEQMKCHGLLWFQIVIFKTSLICLPPKYEAVMAL